jgi:hypothetical protein
MKENTMGAKPRNSKIWAMILEKAIAKKIKSYHELSNFDYE